MVAAGVFLIARVSPLIETSETSKITVVQTSARSRRFFMGLVALTQNDIKRVVAYSTLSQLGYMTAALGRRRTRGHFPPHDARVLQGGAVPRRRLGD